MATGNTHPAQWLPDPTGTHQQRYWNGNRWTEHVADNGLAALDPIGEQPTAPTVDPSGSPSTSSSAGGMFAGMRRASLLRKAQRAQENYDTQFANWSHDDAEIRDLVERARHFDGSAAIDTPLVLKRNERAFFVLSGAGLMETRSGARHWQGGYSGFSFRVTKGIRYHVGGTRGTSVQGPDETKLLDTGTATITNQRIVFQGQKQQREWAFSKLLGYQHDEHSPWTPIQVSNRQKVSGIRYDANTAQAFQFNLALAIATFNDTRDTFAAGLATELEQHQSQKPVAPIGEAVPVAGATATGPLTSNTAGPGSGVLASYKRSPIWLRIALPLIALLVVIYAIGAMTGGGSSDGNNSVRVKHAAPIVTAATRPIETTTTVPPTTVPPTTAPPVTEPPTTVPLATDPPAPPATDAPVAAPPAQNVVHPGAFCAPVGATGVTDAGTPMVCSATSADGTPYTQPRWRSA